MKFSIYSELQSWPGKDYAALYGEVLEQIENADRLGYDAYAAVEHFFYPKFSASANVFGLFGMAAARTRTIAFRTMLHVLPYHNPLVLAAQIHQFSILTGAAGTSSASAAGTAGSRSPPDCRWTRSRGRATRRRSISSSPR
jgi:hypothetical protein